MTFQREYVGSDFDSMSTEKIREIRGVATRRLNHLRREEKAVKRSGGDWLAWSDETCGERDYYALVLQWSSRVIMERFDAGGLVEAGS